MSIRTVEICGFGVIQILISCPRTRPGVALRKVTPSVQQIVSETPLGSEQRIDRISVFFTLNGEHSLGLIDQGIQKVRSVGKCFNVALITPTWCFTELTDPEFEEFIEAGLLRGAAFTAQKFGHPVTRVVERMKAVLRTPRISAIFQTEML